MKVKVCCLFCNPDYVLAYQKVPNDDKSETRRGVFESNLKRAGLKLEYEDNTVSA